MFGVSSFSELAFSEVHVSAIKYFYANSFQPDNAILTESIAFISTDSNELNDSHSVISYANALIANELFVSDESESLNSTSSLQINSILDSYQSINQVQSESSVHIYSDALLYSGDGILDSGTLVIISSNIYDSLTNNEFQSESNVYIGNNVYYDKSSDVMYSNSTLGISFSVNHNDQNNFSVFDIVFGLYGLNNNASVISSDNKSNLIPIKLIPVLKPIKKLNS